MIIEDLMGDVYNLTRGIKTVAYPSPEEAAFKGRLTEVIEMLSRNERTLRQALEHIISVTSGEKQVSNDDTEGMAYVNKYARKVLGS